MKRRFTFLPDDSSRFLARSWSFPLALHDEPAGGASGDAKPPAGDAKPAEGDGKPPEGDGKPAPTTLVGGSDAPADDTAPPKPAAPVVPEKYELTLPKDSTLEPAILERTAATARALGLPTNDAAQKVVDFVNTEVSAHVKALTEAHQPGGTEWTKNVEQWEKQALADAELGGTPEKLALTATQASRVLKTFFPQSVQQLLHNTGFGSHPDVLRALTKIAKMVGEDKLVVTDAPGEKKDRSVEDLFYAESTSKKGAHA